MDDNNNNKYNDMKFIVRKIAYSHFLSNLFVFHSIGIFLELKLVSLHVLCDSLLISVFNTISHINA